MDYEEVDEETKKILRRQAEIAVAFMAIAEENKDSEEPTGLMILNFLNDFETNPLELISGLGQVNTVLIMMLAKMTGWAETDIIQKIAIMNQEI